MEGQKRKRSSTDDESNSQRKPKRPRRRGCRWTQKKRRQTRSKAQIKEALKNENLRGDPDVGIVTGDPQDNSTAGVLATSDQTDESKENATGKKSEEQSEEQNVEIEKEDDDDLDEEDDFDSGKDDAVSKVVTGHMTSLRADLVLKTGLGIARNKIETLFYESKIRVNGGKINKKSQRVNVGDEVDVIKGASPINPCLTVVSRVVVLSVKEHEDGDKLSVKMRRYKSLNIENTDTYGAI